MKENTQQALLQGSSFPSIFLPPPRSTRTTTTTAIMARWAVAVAGSMALLSLSHHPSSSSGMRMADAVITTPRASQRVQDLVSSMSLEDKVGQMAELDIAIAVNW